MAYEKYITRNGRTYGPYVYESKRINGKVISEYRGQNKKRDDKKYLLFGSLIVIVLLSAFIFLLSSQFTGKSILNFENQLDDGELSGSINLVLKPGELIPENSVLLIENGNNTYNFTLNEILSTEKQEGNYFLEDKNLEGTGYGYGFIGKKETTPTVFFELKISPKETSGSEENPIEENTTTETQVETIPTNETTIEENKTVENSLETIETTNEETSTIENTNEEEPTEIKTEENPIEETSTTTTETTIEETSNIENTNEEEPINEEPTGTPITGNVISKLFSGTSNFFRGFFTGNVIEESTFQGDVKKGETFTYTIQENSEIEIIEGSVKTETTLLDNSVLILNRNENTLEITTNYSIVEEGFGIDYLNDEEKNLIIDLKELGIDLVEGEITIKLIYLDTELMDLSSEVVKTNETIKEEKNTTEEIIEEIFNETIENETLTNETKILSENINLTLEEKAILKFMFQNETIDIQAYEYKDKILVDFEIKNYSMTQAYENDLSNEEIEKLIERDKIIWLKDLVNEYNKKEINEVEKTDLNLTTSF